MTLTVIAPPAGEALSLDAAKDYLRIGHDGEDALVNSLIAAARARLETEAGLALVTRTVRRTYDAWPPSLTRQGMRLRPGPVRNLVSVALVNGAGDTDLLTGRFFLSEGRLKLRHFVGLPGVEEGGRVEITFETGYGAPEEVPEDLVQALKRLVLVGYQRGGTEKPEDVLAALGARREARL